MKKSIIALGAAVALGGLGFAGAANAEAYFGPGATFTHVNGALSAVDLKLNTGGTGHMLYAPYYSAQGSMSTIVTIVNTDSKNGKAVKVRFRGAANSDDVMDFTVLLSPSDVWSAAVTKNSAGVPVLSTPDTSCTIPAIDGKTSTFSGQRLPDYLSNSQKNEQIAEGYIEVLNMADIPEVNTGGKNTSLYENIKHNTSGTNKGKPVNCAHTSVVALEKAGATNAAGIEALGLKAPTGQLMGTFGVVNLTHLDVYGREMTAVQAVDGATPPKNAYGNIIFSPQSDNAVAGVNVKHVTADPLLHTTGYITPLWMDLPDMSTPLVSTFNSQPNAQVNNMDILHSKMMNEYMADITGVGGIPVVTDWVLSQPTRRYYAAVDYGTDLARAKLSDARIVYNSNMNAVAGALAGVTTTPALGNNIYRNLTLNKEHPKGLAYACIAGSVSTFDREEYEPVVSSRARFSPVRVSNPDELCGEVLVLSFGANSILGSTVTNVKVSNVAGTAGWGTMTLSNSAELPLVGFAANSVAAGGGTFGQTFGHRW